jgi:hypothetical protein
MRGQKRVEDARKRADARASIVFAEKSFAKRMDCRVKPGNDVGSVGFNGCWVLGLTHG